MASGEKVEMIWIDVKQELPPEGDAVLVASRYWNANPFVARLINGEWEGERILSRPSSVTHWLRLRTPKAVNPNEDRS